MTASIADTSPDDVAANSGENSGDTALKGVGGRSLKMRKDGVAYTDTNKMIAVHYAFADTKKRKLDQSVEDLGCGKTALYRWKKLFPVAAGSVDAVPGSALSKIMEAIQSRTDAENLKIFRQPTFSGALSSAQPVAQAGSQAAPLPELPLRPDGLGPAAENATASGVQPGMLPHILVSALRRIENATPITDEELRKVCVSMDDDVEPAAEEFVQESVGLGVRLKDQNLKAQAEHQVSAWWRALNRLRAVGDAEGLAAESADVQVTEQKLLTWL
ncbi:hypothetical protein OC844_007892, partial [Tilletia horrida]